MFETVPYLRRGGVRVWGPGDERLEAVLVALQVERFLGLGPKVLGRFLAAHEETMPLAARVGGEVHRSGMLRQMCGSAAPASEVVRALDGKMRPVF